VTRPGLLAELAECNPHRASPPVPTAADMLAVIEDMAPPSAARRVARPRYRACAALAVTLIAVAAVAGAVWQASVGSNGFVDVTAAAYAATSPGARVLEASYEARTYASGRRVETLVQTVWLDTASSRARELIELSDADRRQTIDRISQPGWITTWSSTDPRVMLRERSTVRYDTAASWSIGGLQVPGLGGVQLFRALYRAHKLRLAGRSASGQWRLESELMKTAGGPALKLIALVDPHSFLPRTQELVEVGPANQQSVLARVRMLAYGTPPPGSVRTFDLAVQHPKAKVRVRHDSSPSFEPLIRHRASRRDG
jgi:hypothetical protein